MIKLCACLSSMHITKLSYESTAVKWGVFFIEMVLLIFFIYRTAGCFLIIKKRLPARIFLAAACMMLGMMVIILSDMDNLPPTLLLFTAAVWLSCQGSRLKRITMALILARTVFTYNALIDRFFLSFYPAQAGLRIICAFILYGGARRLAPEHDFELTGTLWKILLLLTAAPVGIVLCTVLLSRYAPFRNDVQNVSLLGLALFSFAGLLATTALLARWREMEESRNLLEMNQQYYKAMEEQNFEVRRLKHDLSNHLQTLLSLSGEEKNHYVKQLLENPVAYKTMRYCADETVNIVLSVKASAMERKQIRFDVNADISQTLPLEKPDLCAILGNALDNAAEAAEAFPPEERYVRLEARYAKGMFVLKIVNPARDNRQKEAPGIPGTSKKDARAHGYGLKSIEKSVKKYDGKLELKREDGRFILFLYIP